jgi:predicted DNA-binding transcriptional regulator AlpA
MVMSNQEILLTADELSKILSVSRQTIYRWRKEKLLPDGFLVAGTRRLWSISELKSHDSSFRRVFEEIEKHLNIKGEN